MAVFGRTGYDRLISFRAAERGAGGVGGPRRCAGGFRPARLQKFVRRLNRVFTSNREERFHGEFLFARVGTLVAFAAPCGCGAGRGVNTGHDGHGAANDNIRACSAYKRSRSGTCRADRVHRIDSTRSTPQTDSRIQRPRRPGRDVQPWLHDPPTAAISAVAACDAPLMGKKKPARKEARGLEESIRRASTPELPAI